MGMLLGELKSKAIWKRNQSGEEKEFQTVGTRV